MNFKKLIVESGKKMSGSGLTVETWGNISFRDKETGLVYLTPSAMLYDTIVEDDVVVCTLDGSIVEGRRKPTIETGMHLSVYRNREDVNAIIHTHPIYSMVYASQGKDIPLIIDEAAQILGEVKLNSFLVDIGRRNMLKGNPTMTSRRFQETLEELKKSAVSYKKEDGSKRESVHAAERSEHE